MPFISRMLSRAGPHPVHLNRKRDRRASVDKPSSAETRLQVIGTITSRGAAVYSGGCVASAWTGPPNSRTLRWAANHGRFEQAVAKRNSRARSGKDPGGSDKLSQTFPGERRNRICMIAAHRGVIA